MDVAAKLSSKGQITIPKSVRECLELEEGDDVFFRVEGRRAIVSKTPQFLDLAGSISVPAEKRNATWDAILHSARVRRTTPLS